LKGQAFKVASISDLKNSITHLPVIGNAINLFPSKSPKLLGEKLKKEKLQRSFKKLNGAGFSFT